MGRPSAIFNINIISNNQFVFDLGQEGEYFSSYWGRGDYPIEPDGRLWYFGP